MSRFAPPAFLMLSLLLLSAPAYGWRQTTTCIDEDPGVPTRTPYCEGDEFPMGFYWPDARATYAVNRHGSEDVGDGVEITEGLLLTVQRSFDAWNEPDCSVFEFSYGGLTETREYLPEDGENVVVFHDDQWPYSSGALAITSVTADPQGVIINADMEINGVDHVFASGDGDEEEWDIQNTVTHEAGHVLGLDHSTVEDSTMAFEADPGETKKRDLHPDDIEGLCTIYAPENFPDPPEDDMEPKAGNGCCATVAGRSNMAGALAALLLLVTFARRRSPT